MGRRCRALSLLDMSHPRGGGLYGAQKRDLSRPKSGSRNTWRLIHVCGTPMFFFSPAGVSDTLGRGLASQKSLRNCPNGFLWSLKTGG